MSLEASGLEDLQKKIYRIRDWLFLSRCLGKRPGGGFFKFFTKQLLADFLKFFTKQYLADFFGRSCEYMAVHPL
jgi:hypothetical protein